MRPDIKKERREKRKLSIRKRVSGTPERPRLSVFKSNRHIYAQLIDDVAGVTLVSASSDEKGFTKPQGDKKAVAAKVGQTIAMKCKEKGIETVVFDRNGYPFHGRLKALADAAREHGLKF
ncbi:MAG TPA: 50S ribosomal protein L18 [bacterium]|nr:50S ribosomal protein L18 [bacterium]